MSTLLGSLPSPFSPQMVTGGVHEAEKSRYFRVKLLATVRNWRGFREGSQKHKRPSYNVT